MMASLFLLGARHRAIVASVVVVVTLLTALGLADLKIDTSFDSLIPEDDPGRLMYRKVMGEFGSDNKTIIYIGDDELWTTDKLSRLESLHTGLKRLDHVRRVDSLFTLRTIEEFASFSLMGEVAIMDLVATRPMYVMSWFNSLGVHQHPALETTLVLLIHERG